MNNSRDMSESLSSVIKSRDIWTRLASILAFLIISSGTVAFAQPYIVPHSVDKAIIIDGLLIQRIADEMLITIEDETPEKMEIIDITQDGFGKNDIAKIYPSGKYYRLTEISDSLEEEIGTWKREVSLDITFNLEPSENFYKLYEQKHSPQYLLLASVTHALERVYKDNLPIELYFQRDSSGIIFNYWGYDADSLIYSPGRPVGFESSTVYDLMYVLSNDTTFIADTTLYDLMFIYKTLVDTMFIPEKGEMKPGRGPILENNEFQK